MGLGDLHGEGADAAGRADDRDLLSGLDPACVSDRLQRGHAGGRHGRGLDGAEWFGPVDHHRCVDHGELGEGAVAEADDLVADVDPVDVLADGDHSAGDVGAEHGVLGPVEPVAHQAGEVGPAAHLECVASVDAGGVDLDQHAVVGDGGSLDVAEAEDVGGAEPVSRDRSHGVHRRVVRRVLSLRIDGCRDVHATAPIRRSSAGRSSVGAVSIGVSRSRRWPLVSSHRANQTSAMSAGARTIADADPS